MDSGLDGRASLRRAAQVKPRLKPTDHFDIFTAFADDEHGRGEQAKRDARNARNAAFRANLDGQLAEQRQRKQREAEEQRNWQQVVFRNADSHKQNEDAAKRKKAEIADEMRRQAAESAAALARRKERDDREREREREELDRAMALDRLAAERETKAKADLLAKRSKDARENFEAAAREREAKKNAEFEESKALAAELKRQSEAREAEANAGYRKAQAVVDRLTSTLGVANAAVLAQKDSAEDQRINKAFEHKKRQWVEDYWKEEEVRGRREHENSAGNTKLADEVRATRGVAEREANRKQGEIWRKQDAEHWESVRRKAEKARRDRDTVDSTLLRTVHSNSGLHHSDFNVTDHMREREMSYNRSTIDRMTSEGFCPHLTQPLALKANQLTLTMRSAKAM